MADKYKTRFLGDGSAELLDSDSIEVTFTYDNGDKGHPVARHNSSSPTAAIRIFAWNHIEHLESIVERKERDFYKVR